MSAVASLSSNPQALLLERIRQQSQLSASPSAARAEHAGRAPSEQFKAQFQSALQAEGVDPGQFSTIQAEIQDAVTKASQGTSGADRHAAVQSAVSDVLKSHGIDPQDFKTKLDSALQSSGIKQHRHHHHGAQSVNQNSGQDADGDNDGTGASIAQTLRSLPAGSVVDEQA